jgi:hypothetical protein
MKNAELTLRIDPELPFDQSLFGFDSIKTRL